MNVLKKKSNCPVYEGFGELHTCAEWSRRLGINKQTLWNNLKKGKSVEVIAAWYGLKYNPADWPEDTGGRKPRQGAQMAETQRLVHRLLTVSGYVIASDLQAVTVRLIYPPIHAVSFLGTPVGSYNYRTGWMKLSGGGGVDLVKWDWTETKIIQRTDGKWVLHPKTHSDRVRAILDDFAKE